MKKSIKKNVIIFSIIFIILLLILNWRFGLTNILNFYIHKDEFQRITEYILNNSNENSDIYISYETVGTSIVPELIFRRYTDKNNNLSDIYEFKGDKKVISELSKIKNRNFKCVKYCNSRTVSFCFGINNYFVYNSNDNPDDVNLADYEDIHSVSRLCENWYLFSLED